MATGEQIAADGLSYRGHVHYVSGGAPGAGPPGTAGPCDCSSWLNKVTAVDFRMPIPGLAAGAYRGQDHGPVVMDWASWKGCATLPRGQRPAPGDLCIWPGWGDFGHIGIATGPHTMVSNLNPEMGVRETGIEGNGPIPDQFIIFRSITAAAAAPSAAAAAGSSPGSSAGATAGYALLGLAAPLAGVALVVGGAAVAGALGALIIGLIMVRAVRSGQ